MERPKDYETLTTLNISRKELTELPSWISECHNLKELICSINQITQLDNLPPTSKALNYRSNKITHLDNLPLTLKELFCKYNSLKYDFEPTLENIRNYNKLK